MRLFTETRNNSSEDHEKESNDGRNEIVFMEMESNDNQEE